ncbi:hypothetical protein RhiirC2_704243 [Rhizophagus irregularis]|uniref:Uncharacterized protein n=1 Tax=Rhizophagus irregularis TaxID=588596 RepID=A0A2N1P2S7_9GLOM|nr:hypothetical protein RhiirC2_704243 [Rhizophagus irregularis]
MDFGLNNEKKNKRNHYLNIIFLGIFLAEIIIYIIGIIIGIVFFRKTLLYLLAFCVVNIIQSIILIDVFIVSDVTLVTILTKPEKDYNMTLIISNIIVNVFFVFLYIILIIMMWKNKYWNVISRTKILIPNDMIKRYFFAIWTLEFPITRILGLTLFGLTFINTILCHRNFGKNFTFYVESMKFNPNLDKEFEYSNDLDDDDDDDDEEEEEEKDEKILERLKRYWKFIKKTFYDVFIPLIEE